jgi:hypothetical protein
VALVSVLAGLTPSPSAEAVPRQAAGAPAWFAAMADGTWTTVSSTATIMSVSPNPSPPGAEGVSAVCNDWTGGCVNQATGEYILPAQGGHNGYYGNEIYALALRDPNPAWKRIWGPTPNSQISTSDFPYNAASTAYGDGSPRPAHGWFSNLCSSDGRIWITMVDACPSGQWTTECYSIARGNLAAGWTYHGRLWPTVPGGSPGSTFGYQSGPGAYDPVANKIWRGADFATQDGVASLDVSAAVAAGQQPTSGPQAPGGTIYNAYLPGTTFSGAWSVVAYDLSPRSWIVGAVSLGELWIMDLENSPGTFVKVQTAGSPTGWTTGVKAVYHKQSRSILVGGYEYGASLRRLSISGSNPLTSTYTWSDVPPDPTNAVVPAPAQNGTWNKLQMIEDMGNGQSAICLVTSAAGPTYVYKVPGAAGSPAPPPTPPPPPPPAPGPSPAPGGAPSSGSGSGGHHACGCGSITPGDASRATMWTALAVLGLSILPRRELLRFPRCFQVEERRGP